MRLLNSLEHLFWSVDQAAPLNFTLVSELAGDVPLDLLRHCLSRLTTRYPALTHYVADGANGLEWRPSSHQPRLDLAARTEDPSLLAETINSRFSDGEPAIRVKWLHAKSGGSLMLTFNHALVDGRSGVRVLYSLLHDMATHLEGAEQLNLDPVPLHGGLEPQHYSTVRSRHPISVSQFGESSGSHGTAVLPIDIDRQMSKAFLERCRSHRVSVSSGIAAAHLIGLASVRADRPMSLSLPVDWRGRYDQIEQDAFGLLIGDTRVTYRTTPEDDPWSLARRLKVDLRQGLRRAAPIAPTSGAISPLDIYQARASSAVSNIGRMTTKGLEALCVERLRFAVGCSYFGDQILTVSTVDDRLSLVYCILGRNLDEHVAQGIAEGTMAAFRSMTSN